MKTLTVLPGALLLGAMITTVAIAAPARHSQITIRHQTRHCHAWSLDRGAFTAHIDAKVAVGGSITIVNNDVMPHRLLERSGPNALLSRSPSLTHMGASLKVTFPRAGIYRFTTKAGEDYMKGIETTGEDNVLTLRVAVS
jgi:plastocyanin